jgi:hypothetical protein
MEDPSDMTTMRSMILEVSFSFFIYDETNHCIVGMNLMTITLSMSLSTTPSVTLIISTTLIS